MGTAGLTLFFIGGALGIIHLAVYEWNLEASKEFKWLLSVGFVSSVCLALCGVMVYFYVVLAQGVNLELNELSFHLTPLMIIAALLVLVAVWFWGQHGLSNKVAAVACVYALLVLFGIVPDPAQSDQPWSALVMIGLIGLRWLF